MKRSKKLLALFLALAMVLSLLAGCGGKDSGSGGSQGTQGNIDIDLSGATGGQIGSSEDVTGTGPQELTVGITSDIGSFYPGGAGQAPVKIKRVMCYETLFWKDPDDEFHPLLAKSYESKGDGTYAIELFDYITDSEGNHMTASDAVFSIDLYIEDGQNSSTWATITDYHATGDYTFEVTFAPEVTGQLSDFLTRVPMITQAAWENSPDEMASKPVGTAGYTLDQNASVLGSTYVFVRRDDYWQTDEQYICARNMNNLEKLTVKVIPDVSTLAIELETGGIDFTTEISSNDWSQFMDDSGNTKDGYVMMMGQNNAFVHMTFNCGENSPCQDIKLRQAIAYCIDAAACSYSIYGSLGQVCNTATNPNLSDSSLDYGSDDYYAYNVELAKQLVAESSYKGETLKMLVLPKTTITPVAALIQSYCLQIGVKMELLEYDMAQFRKVRTEPTGAEYDIELLGATSADDTVYVSVKELDNRAYTNGLGRHFVVDDELQTLYEQSGDASTTSPEVIQQLLDRIDENLYIYGLYYCPSLFFGSSKIVSGTVIPFDDAVYPSFVVNNG
jgi:ABC-type transport system substrate-binding protein